MSLTNPNNLVTEQRLAEFYQGIYPYLGGSGEPNQSVVYGFRIDNSESVPSAKVTYLEDAVGMTPAFMNYTTGEFDYGSWGDAFFMPRPCMLKYDGTVDYYLDPNDYTKKEDGVTASDVGNTSYAGNAMMEWGRDGKKIWLKIVPDATASNYSADIYISNKKQDNDYTDWPFHNSAGQSVNHFYTPIYNGSLINDQLRSLSGQAVMQSKRSAQELTYAQANNPSGSLIWTTEVISDITLINFLLILISKTTNTQEAFGMGLSTNGEDWKLANFRTGVHDDKGLFYGTNSSDASSPYTNAVKVFGMENWWGFQQRRYLGEIYNYKSCLRKLTYGTEDGSETTGYNFTGEGYISSGYSISGYNGYYIIRMAFSDLGMIPVFASDSYDGGSGTTHYCDMIEFYNKLAVPVRGGYGYNTEDCNGAFRMKIDEDWSYWHIGAALSAKPLS